MTRRTKAEILEALPFQRLRSLADHFALVGPRRSKAEIVRALVRCRRGGTEAILQALTVSELRALSQTLSSNPSGRKKSDLIDSILDHGSEAKGNNEMVADDTDDELNDIEDSETEEEVVAPGDASLDDGMILDYITGEPVKDSGKEQVRQRLARALFHEYGISVDDMVPNFRMKIDGRSKKLDLAIFIPGTKPSERNPDTLRRVVICEKEPSNGKKSAYRMRDHKQAEKEFGLLHSAMAEAANCLYGLWTNGLEFFFFEKKQTRFDTKFIPIGDWPHADETVGTREVASMARMRRAEPGMLRTAFRRCHNFIHGNEGMPKDAAFWQFLYLILSKMHDEKRSSSSQPRFWAGATEQFEETGREAIRKRVAPLFEEVKKKYKDIFSEVLHDI